MSLKIPPYTASYADPRPSRGRIGLFVAALALSVGLHFWLWAELPHMQVGEMVIRDRPHREATEPMKLGEVRPTPPTSPYEETRRFVPENPDAFEKIAERQQDLLDEFLGEAAAAPYEAAAPARAGEPDIVPDDLYEATAETFRQEIHEIEKRLVDDELAALPRRVTPKVERVQGAPDVTFAAASDLSDRQAAAASGAGAPAVLPPVGAVEQTLSPEDIAVISSMPADDAVAAFNNDLLAIGDERPEDVTPVTPIEDRLAIHTTSWIDRNEEYLYFQIEIGRGSAQALPVLPKDVLLVQDCSESITRRKLDFFKEALEAYLRTLTTVDRFNIMSYSEDVATCFTNWAPVTTETLGQGMRFVDKLRLGGKTDLFASLQQILHVPTNPARPLIVVLLTDGRPTMGLMDNSDIITRFTRLNGGNVSVFTIGAGENVNAFLRDMLAKNNRGSTWAAAERDKIPQLGVSAARELGRPCLMNLSYRMGGDLRAEIYPPALTHLYVDRPLKLVGRAPLAEANGVLQVVGDAGGKKFDMVFPIDLSEAGLGSEAIRREWVQQKIYQILNSNLETKSAAAEAEARELADRYHVQMGW